MAKANPWFRLYTETIDDEKLGLLAFEDRWHFIAILCLKGKGLLDSERDRELLGRKVAFKLGVTVQELENITRRLSRMGLIDADTLQPLAWDDRQMHSDSSTARVQAHRERTKQTKQEGNVSETGQEGELEAEEETDKGHAQPPAAPPGSAPSRARAGKPAVEVPGVPAELLADFLAVRKAKHVGPLTKTALAQLQREADKAGLTLEEAITACCGYGWAGFNATWYADRTAGRKQQGATPPTTSQYDQGMAAAARAKRRIFGDDHAAS